MAKSDDLIRVFISSTFRDMHAERDYLNRFVFPELRNVYARRGIRLVAVDLRWGVTEEESESGQALSRCFQEIENCRPFFLCLLGDRYGWVPDAPEPQEIPGDIFRAVCTRITPENRKTLDLLEQIYRSSEEPDGEVFRLRRVKNSPADFMSRLAAFWKRKAHYSITSREITRAALLQGDLPSYGLFYLRTLSEPKDYPPQLRNAIARTFREHDPASARELAVLKARLKSLQGRPHMVVRDYSATVDGLKIDPCFLPADLSETERRAFSDGTISFAEWPTLRPRIRALASLPDEPAREHAFGTVALSGLDSLGLLVLEDLSKAMDSWLDRQVVTAVPRTLDQPRSYVKERTRLFVGREGEMRELFRYLEDNRNQSPYVVTGPRGCGKSALLAEFARQCRDAHPRSVVIEAFIGTAPGSTDLHRTLKDLCQRLREACAIAEEVPDDPNKLRHLFPRFLAEACRQQQVVLVLDALDQLDPANRSHELDWFPFRLPERAKAVVSALEGDCLEVLKNALALDQPDRTHEKAQARARSITSNENGMFPAVVQDVVSCGDQREPRSTKSSHESLPGETLLKKGCPPDPLPKTFETSGGSDHPRSSRTVGPGLSSFVVAASHDSSWGWGSGGRDFLQEVPSPGKPTSHENIMELGPLPVDKRRDLAEQYLIEQGKKLRKEPLDSLLAKPEAALPLYLIVALEELCLFGLYEHVWRRIDLLPPTVDRLFEQVLMRLESDFGQDFAGSILRWLAASRHGLAESELLDLLAARFPDFDPWQWKRFFYSLQSYLRPAQEIKDLQLGRPALVGFFHDQLRVAAYRRYFGMDQPHAQPTEAFVQANWELAGHFLSISCRQGEPRTWSAALPRGLSELPFHLIRARRWDMVGQVLGDLRFVAAKSAAGMTYDLIADYSMALESHPDTREDREAEAHREEQIQAYVRELVSESSRGEPVKIVPCVRYKIFDYPGPQLLEDLEDDLARIDDNPSVLDVLRAFSRFVSSEADSLARFGTMPGFCVQLAHNSSSSGPVSEAARRDLAENTKGPLILKSEPTRPPYDPQPVLVKTLQGHTEHAYGVGVSADGRRAVSCGQDAIRLWDLMTGECIRTLEGGFGAATTAMTPDGRFAVAQGGESLFIWDLRSGRRTREIVARQGLIFSLAMTPDARYVVSGGEDGTVRVWDVHTAACFRVLEGHTGRVNSVKTTFDGKLVVSAGEDGTIRCWDVPSARCVAVLEDHRSPVYSVAISPDGKWAVSGGDDRTVRYWRPEEGRCLKTLTEHTGIVNSVAITADGRIAISASYDYSPRFWHLHTAQCLSKLTGHTSANVYGVDMTPDGRWAVSCGMDKTVRLWDLVHASLPKLPEKGRPFVVMRGKTPCLWTDTTSFHSYTVPSVDISSDGTFIVSASWDNTVGVWLAGDSYQSFQPLRGHQDGAVSVALSPDRRHAVSGSWAGEIRLWDIEARTPVRAFSAGQLPILALAVTPDGKWALSGSEIDLLLWDLQSGQKLERLDAGLSGVMSIKVSPDGTFAAVTGKHGSSVRFVALDTGRSLKTILARRCATCDELGMVATHEDWRFWTKETFTLSDERCGRARFVCLTPDGRFALITGFSMHIQVWDIRKDACVHILEGHTAPVDGIGISPDGRFAVSAGEDKTVRVWDCRTGECLGVQPTPSQATPTSVAANGRFACGTAGGEILLLTLADFPQAAPIVTPVRMWLLESRAAGPGNLWDKSLTVGCPWCGERFPVSEAILGTIGAIGRSTGLHADQAPCLSLPDEAWDEPRLSSECPLCRKPLRFNPFVVDRSLGTASSE
ncbi:MAG: AAA family ATPase [Thermodesulfobacteriota bacterium]